MLSSSLYILSISIWVATPTKIINIVSIIIVIGYTHKNQ